MASKRQAYVRDKAGKFAKLDQSTLKTAKPKTRSIGKKTTKRSTVTNGMFSTGPKLTRQKRKNLVQKAVEVNVQAKATIPKKG